MKAVMNVFTDDINEYADDNVWCDAADVDGVNELHDVMMDTMDSSGILFKNLSSVLQILLLILYILIWFKINISTFEPIEIEKRAKL